MFGQRDNYELPTDALVLAALDTRLRSFADITIGLPLTDNLLVAAANRSLDKRAPNTNNDHALKDCAIWESVLRLPVGSDVRFVTRDKGFHMEGKPAGGLAADASQRQMTVTWTETLETVLKELQARNTPIIDQQVIAAALHESLQAEYAKVIAHWRLSWLGGEDRFELGPYATEDAARMYVTFMHTLPAGTAVYADITYENTKVRIGGSFSWYPVDGRLADLQIETELLLGQDGATIGENRFINASGALFLGRGTVPYRERQALLGT
jgi:hypothetical protein